MTILYTAYCGDKIVAFSYNKKDLKKYMRKTRGIMNYEISEKFVDPDTIDESSFNDLLVIEYTKDIFTTLKDAEYLDYEVENEFKNFVNTLEGLREYYRKIKNIENLYESATKIYDAIESMENDLTDKKAIRKIVKKIVQFSPITSADPQAYNHSIRIYDEMIALDEWYQYALLKD